MIFRSAAFPSLFFLHPFALTLVAVLGSLLFASLLIAALFRNKKKSSSALLLLVGRAASVEVPLSPQGSVLVNGELWRARSLSGEYVARGQANVRVVGARGHLLLVERRERERRS